MIKKLAHVAKFVIPLVLIFFVGRVIVENWEEVSAAEWHVRPLYLLVSALLCSPWFLLRPLGWNILLNRFGRSVPFAAVFRVNRQAELGRYVPGAVWQWIGRVYLIQKWRVTAAACLVATFVDLILATLASMVPAMFTLDDLLPSVASYYRYVIFAFPFIAVLIIHPKVLNWGAGLVTHRLKIEYSHLHVGYATMASIWAMYVGGWISLCAGVAAFVAGVIDLSSGNLAFIGSSYALAWLVGILTMIAPAGMGVREAALGLLLAQVVGTGTGFTLAVAIRLWLLVVELVWYGSTHLMPVPSPPEDGEPDDEHPAVAS